MVGSATLGRPPPREECAGVPKHLGRMAVPEDRLESRSTDPARQLRSHASRADEGRGLERWTSRLLPSRRALRGRCLHVTRASGRGRHSLSSGFSPHRPNRSWKTSTRSRSMQAVVSEASAPAGVTAQEVGCVSGKHPMGMQPPPPVSRHTITKGGGRWSRADPGMCQPAVVCDRRRALR